MYEVTKIGGENDTGTGEKELEVIESVGIDGLVPQDHLLRKVEQAVDLTGCMKWWSRCIVRTTAGRAWTP